MATNWPAWHSHAPCESEPPVGFHAKPRDVEDRAKIQDDFIKKNQAQTVTLATAKSFLSKWIVRLNELRSKSIFVEDERAKDLLD